MLTVNLLPSALLAAIKRARRVARIRAWQLAHRDRVRLLKRRWRAENPEHVNQYHRRYRAEHHGHIRDLERASQARRKERSLV